MQKDGQTAAKFPYILDFVLKKSDWIISKKSEIREMQSKLIKREFKDKSTFMYLGKECPIKLIYNEKLKKVEITIKSNNSENINKKENECFYFEIKTNTYNEEILRKALEGVLPEDVVYRKKSPYPKTHNPIYTEMVCKEMNKILSDNNSPILEIIDNKVVKEIVDTEGKSYTTPWFGQLMTGPQLIAYLIQLNIWMKEYNVNILI